MKLATTSSAMYCDSYSIFRWWPYDSAGNNLHGAYFLVCNNSELYLLQQNFNPHVACIVDDFGNLVRKS